MILLYYQVVEREVINRKDSSVKYLAAPCEDSSEMVDEEEDRFYDRDDVQPFIAVSPKSKFIASKAESKPDNFLVAPVRRNSLTFQKDVRRVLLVDGTANLLNRSMLLFT